MKIGKFIVEIAILKKLKIKKARLFLSFKLFLATFNSKRLINDSNIAVKNVYKVFIKDFYILILWPGCYVNNKYVLIRAIATSDEKQS